MVSLPGAEPVCAKPFTWTSPSACGRYNANKIAAQCHKDGIVAAAALSAGLFQADDCARPYVDECASQSVKAKTETSKKVQAKVRPFVPSPQAWLSKCASSVALQRPSTMTDVLSDPGSPNRL